MDYERMHSAVDMAPLPREEIAHRLVRLDTEIRDQLDREGWEGAHPDGFLTEEELLNAARTQGILKKRLRNWRTITLIALVWLLVSSAIVLSMVIVGNNMMKEMEVRGSDGVLFAKGTGHIIQTTQVTRSFHLTDWASQNPVNILNLERVVMVPANGTILSMTVAAANADFSTNVLTVQSAGGGYFVIENGKAVALDMEISQMPADALKSYGGLKHFQKGMAMDTLEALDAYEGMVHTPGNAIPPLIQGGYCVCGLSKFCSGCPA